jgi:hypothetical protein
MSRAQPMFGAINGGAGFKFDGQGHGTHLPIL